MLDNVWINSNLRDLRHISSYFFLSKETNIKDIAKLLRCFSASWILALTEGIRVLAEVKWFVITYFKIPIYNFAWEVVSFLYFKMTHIFFLIWISGFFDNNFGIHTENQIQSCCIILKIELTPSNFMIDYEWVIQIFLKKTESKQFVNWQKIKSQVYAHTV